MIHFVCEKIDHCWTPRRLVLKPLKLLRRQAPFCVDHITCSGSEIGYDIQAALDVACMNLNVMLLCKVKHIHRQRQQLVRPGAALFLQV